MRPVCLIAALFAAGLSASAVAQERRVPTQSELRLSYAPVVQRVAPAVVNVYAAKVVQNRNPLLDDPIFRRFFGVPGGLGNQVQRSLGSGVIVDASGLIVSSTRFCASRLRIPCAFSTSAPTSGTIRATHR